MFPRENCINFPGKVCFLTQEEFLTKTKRLLYFCEFLSYAKDCSVAVRSRAMSAQAARETLTSLREGKQPLPPTLPV